VSVIIPVYDGELYLREAIESALCQTVPPLEILVVDDGSQDGSAEVAGSVGGVVRCVRQTHAGAAAARNLGARLSRGDWLAFLDADDCWMPDKTHMQLQRLQALNGPTAALCHMEEFASPELRGHVGRVRPVIAGASVCTLLVRKEHFHAVGEFSTRWSRGEFIDWHSRAARWGLRFEMLPEVLARRRIHATNHTRHTGTIADYAFVVREVRRRQREGAASVRDD
jgi:glycosyltransferase involved in cell wall biosynthesis